MKNIYFGFVLVILMSGFVACKSKPTAKTQKPVKKTVVVKKVVKDTTKVDSSLVAKPKKVIKETVPPPANKYFLIAGSFQSMKNAESFKEKLSGEGFDSQVIERRNGPNTEFFKVSYMGFYDKKMALAELKRARSEEQRSDVWLLVKR